MKKLITIIISAVMMSVLCSCASVNITITKKDNILKKIEETNKYDEMTKQYGPLSVDVSGNYMDGKKVEYTIYRDGGKYAVFYTNGMLIDDGGDVYGYWNDTDEYYRYLFVGDSYDYFKNIHEYNSSFFYNEKEKIISQEDKGDTIMVSTTTPTSENADILKAWGFSPENVEETISEYVVDKKTMVLLSGDSFLVIDGEKIPFTHDAIKLNRDEYVPDDQILERIFGDDSRTLTVITDAGSENEKKYTQTVTKGSWIYIYGEPEFEDTMYEDPDCTIEADYSDLESDRTVYIKRKENL